MSHLSISSWYEQNGDPTVADGILDRLILRWGDAEF